MVKKDNAGPPKKKGGRRRSARLTRPRPKISEALSYRRLGYTYAQIAETMSISVATSHRWVSEAIKAIPAEEAAHVRKQMLDRLDYLMQALMKAVARDRREELWPRSS